MTHTHIHRTYDKSQQKFAVETLRAEESASTWCLEREETARDAAAWRADVPQSVDILRPSVPAARLDFTPGSTDPVDGWMHGWIERESARERERLRVPQRLDIRLWALAARLDFTP